MGLFSKKNKQAETRSSPSEQMKEFIKGVDFDNQIGNSNSGVRVDETTAMQTSAVYACVKILAESVASLPLHLFKRWKK